MGAEENIKTIKDVYEAFARGDVEAVLSKLANDVDWAAETTSMAAPWYGIRHGKDEVATFFQEFGSTMEVQEFTPHAFAATDTEVHTLVRCRATSRSTGRSIDQDLHHFFRLQSGRIVYYRGTEDT